jgi:hypothetical protein
MRVSVNGRPGAASPTVHPLSQEDLPMRTPTTPTMRHRLMLPLLAAACLAMSACTKKDPVAADLLSLNAAGKAATQNTDLDKSMEKVQQAQTAAEKARFLRESAVSLDKIGAAMQKTDIQTSEVKDIQARLTAAYGKFSKATNDTADALEKSDAAALEQAGRALEAGQADVNAVGQDVSRLAKEHKVDMLQKAP